MTENLKLALPQMVPVWLDRDKTLTKACGLVREAAANGADLIVFGEGAVPGYPFWVSETGGAKFNDAKQKEIFAYYSDQAISLEAGHLEDICGLAKSKNIAIYLGIIERASDRSGHSLYCSYVYINRNGDIGSVHRKLQPTYEERLVWHRATGRASSPINSAGSPSAH